MNCRQGQGRIRICENRFLGRAWNPVSAFCRTCRGMGYELYEMELIASGEEFHAAMKRSTNGGGENSPMLTAEDDFYELFFSSLESLDGAKTEDTEKN